MKQKVEKNKFLESIDLFKFIPYLLIDKKKSFSSNFSSILSIIIYLYSLYIITYMLLSLVNNEINYQSDLHEQRPQNQSIFMN